MHKTLPYLLCGTAAIILVGCEHLTESRVVHRFAESIKEHDLARMKAESSQEFEDKAVSGDDTFRALKLLDLPEGMPKVVRVYDIKDEKSKAVVQKRVWAKVGKEQRKIAFLLKKDDPSGKWVVDDFYLSKADLENNRPVAARLAVLLSLQESLDAWKSGDRERILAAATPEFAQTLGQLTPAQIAQFAKKITENLADTTKILSDERIGDETAELSVAKLEADLVMSFRREGARWRLDDLAVRARRTGDDLNSARLVSSAMAAALRFEVAYHQADKRTLQEVCTPRFFGGSLAAADLSTVRLPESGQGLDDFEIKLVEKTATFTTRAGDEWLKISLAQQPAERLHAAVRYLVDEVSIYDRQDKRLSALFTARATVEQFSAALARCDVKAIFNYASHDFNERVWERTTPNLLGKLPTAILMRERPNVLQTHFQGAVTEILVEHGATPVTYRLCDEGGRIVVDDILVPATDWPESIKETAEVLVPILCFRQALAQSQMESVRACTTGDFSRYAWSHFDVAPRFDIPPEDFFSAPLTRITRKDDHALVVFGDDRHGAQFDVVRERKQLQIDDVTLISGLGDDQRIALKRAIRMQLARGDVSETGASPGVSRSPSRESALAQ